MRVKTAASYERWGEDERGHATYREVRIEASAEVDLDAETVTLLECDPPVAELTDREIDDVENDLYAEALRVRRDGENRAAAVVRSSDIAAEIRALALDISRIAARRETDAVAEGLAS